MTKRKIWLVTGISSGLGKAIASAAMAKGHFVIGTFRAEDQVSKFNDEYGNKAIAIQLDITNEQNRMQVSAFVEERFGRIDVLVNNAGFGFAGAVEEATMDEVRQVFETNFFGTLGMTQVLLPLFRKGKQGHIVQISSHGGVKASAGFGIYNASKFALEGFSEALAAEVAPLGIKLTIVEPGPFRTNFATMVRHGKVELRDYNETAGAFKNRLKQMHGKQEGDPEKAGRAIVNLIDDPDPPLRLPLGRTALQTINAKLEMIRSDLARTTAIAANCSFN